MALKVNEINHLVVTKTVTKLSPVSPLKIRKRGKIGILSQIVNWTLI